MKRTVLLLAMLAMSVFLAAPAALAQGPQGQVERGPTTPTRSARSRGSTTTPLRAVRCSLTGRASGRVSSTRPTGRASRGLTSCATGISSLIPRASKKKHPSEELTARLRHLRRGPPSNFSSGVRGRRVLRTARVRSSPKLRQPFKPFTLSALTQNNAGRETAGATGPIGDSSNCR